MGRPGTVTPDIRMSAMSSWDGGHRRQRYCVHYTYRRSERCGPLNGHPSAQFNVDGTVDPGCLAPWTLEPHPHQPHLAPDVNWYLDWTTVQQQCAVRSPGTRNLGLAGSRHVPKCKRIGFRGFIITVIVLYRTVLCTA